jgi:hypothetical protein
MISDKRSPGALNAICDYAVTYLAKAYPEDYAPEAHSFGKTVKKELDNEHWGKE